MQRFNQRNRHVSQSIPCLCVIQSAKSRSPGNQPVTDSVIIEGLAVEAIIGVYDWEREVSQQLLIDLEMAWDNSVPAASDDVVDALDYAAVSEKITGYLSVIRPQLLETAAEGIAGLLQKEFGVYWLRLVIRKPGAVPAAASVGVSIERGIR